MKGAIPGSPLARSILDAALHGDTEEWERLHEVRRENGDILDAFHDHLRSLGVLHVEYDLLEVEREGERIFVNFEDPSRKLRSFSPRTFAVERRADGGFTFEEV